MTSHEKLLHDRANELLRSGAAGAYEQLATEYERAVRLAPNLWLVARIQLLQGDVSGAIEVVLKVEE